MTEVEITTKEINTLVEYTNAGLIQWERLGGPVTTPFYRCTYEAGTVTFQNDHVTVDTPSGERVVLSGGRTVFTPLYRAIRANVAAAKGVR